jgi:Domain of unknown function (DUF4915)
MEAFGLLGRGDSVLLISGLDERATGGLFVFDGSDLVAIDRLSSTGIAVTETTVGRLVQSPVDYPPGAQFFVYDQIGVKEFRRLDEVVDPHDLVPFGDGEWLAVSSTRNAIFRVHLDGTVETVWQPSLVTDSWHVNCIAMADGELWVTAFGRFESSREWSGEGGLGTGFLRNLTTGEEFGGLSHPHSPCCISGRWWVCNSLDKSLVRWDGDAWEHVATLQGYPRGLATDGDQVFVGESAHRGAESGCASLVVLRDGDVVSRIALPCAEIYDLTICPVNLVDGLRRGFNMPHADADADADANGADRLIMMDVMDQIGDPRILRGIGEPLRPEEVATRVRIEPFPTMEVGDRRALVANVENLGSSTFASIHPFPVNLSYRWNDEEGRQIDGQRTHLGRPLLPGAEEAYEIIVQAPLEPGEYSLSVSLVQDGNFWLDEISASNGTRFHVSVV